MVADRIVVVRKLQKCNGAKVSASSCFVAEHNQQWEDDLKRSDVTFDHDFTVELFRCNIILQV
ncbi:MAG: hypothetical protein IM591_15880 [Chitinophagaceae bacterium]|nr:hypothetical protein [Chitinophagaceae bacterium]MCA6496250.1 hypothetical protein [Chitinophagaceae bacterium]